MKSTGIIMEGFSIGGLLKEYRRSIAVKHAAPGVALPDEMSKGLGCKTETRRMRGLDEVNKEPDRWVLSGLYPQGTADGRFFFKEKGDMPIYEMMVKCPYGVVGDELWVKERWGIEFNATEGKILYKESVTPTSFQDRATKWKSPLFMPKAASRIKLEITGIGLERLHDITEEGAMREGVTLEGIASSHGHLNYRMAFAVRWTELHNNYNSNPWVWVIQFTVKEFKI